MAPFALLPGVPLVTLVTLGHLCLLFVVENLSHLSMHQATLDRRFGFQRGLFGEPLTDPSLVEGIALEGLVDLAAKLAELGACGGTLVPCPVEDRIDLLGLCTA